MPSAPRRSSGLPRPVVDIAREDLALLDGPEQGYQTTEEFLNTIDANLKARLAA